jgi:hypothetical protein
MGAAAEADAKVDADAWVRSPKWFLISKIPSPNLYILSDPCKRLLEKPKLLVSD